MQWWWSKCISIIQDSKQFKSNVAIEKASGTHKFACTQVQKTIAGRHDILKASYFSTSNDHSIDPKHTWNNTSNGFLNHQEVEANSVDLWDDT